MTQIEGAYQDAVAYDYYSLVESATDAAIANSLQTFRKSAWANDACGGSITQNINQEFTYCDWYETLDKFGNPPTSDQAKKKAIWKDIKGCSLSATSGSSSFCEVYLKTKSEFTPDLPY